MNSGLRHAVFRSGVTTPRVNNEEKITAWKREVSEWKQEIETCLLELAEAIRREDFDTARNLKAQREYLKSKPLPEPPSWGGQTITSEVTGKNSQKFESQYVEFFRS